MAHRGDPVGHRENTLEAFEAARALGAEMVELDCRLTRDGQVMVLHDATLARLWGDPRPLGEIDGDEARSLRQEGYRIPSLEEVLDTVTLQVMVDLPDPRAAGPSWSVVRDAGAAERCIFAGNTSGLQHLRELSADLRIALTWDKIELPSRALIQGLRPEWWNPYYRLASPAAVEWAHTSGMGVSVWTVDSRRDIARVLDAGADAVISNQVARVVEELAGRRAQPAIP
ncbi:MAG: glycerophosphodiester phosphodiesterase [Acidimicrobiales bacterium]